jgi:transcriptional regulator with XRE-family HTH domain
MNVDDVMTMLETGRVSTVQLARRSGVSRNTQWLLRQDPTRAKLSTLRELALAYGLDLVIQTQPASDALASAAARWILGDFTDPGASATAIQDWVVRLQRWTGDTEPLKVAAAAATVAAPQNRTGSVLLRGRKDATRMASAGSASGQPWALSGGPALTALGIEVPSDAPTVMWAAEPSRIRELLGPTHEPTRVLGAASVIISPSSDLVVAGATEVDGIPLVTPVQMLIDCLGVGGPLAELAETVAKEW